MPAPLREIVSKLEKSYGRQALAAPDPFAHILWENCAYLVDDERRRAAFEALRKATRLKPEAILRMKDRDLQALIAEGGMKPAMRAEKLRACAALALEHGMPEPAALRADPRTGRRLLRRFPGVGDPGADKLLMIAGAVKSLAPDSNALRVLVRLGFGADSPNYARSYRSAAEAVAPELPDDAGWLIRAHLVLRRHGQELCRRSGPRCEACPLRASCPWYQHSRAQG